jgi:hypothetical protein
MLKRMTQEQADRFDKKIDPDSGKPVEVPVDRSATGVDATKTANPDRTHLNPHGQKVFGRMVADQLVRTQVELGPDLIGVPGGSLTTSPNGSTVSQPVRSSAQAVTTLN